MDTIADRIETLRRARELIAPEGAWTQGQNARNAAGLTVDPLGRDAVCWCSYGAILRSVTSAADFDGAHAMEALRTVIDARFVIDWNDDQDREKAEVLAAFDAAIAALVVQS
jgi:hypothetical protein